MDAPDAPHTPKYIDGGATNNPSGKSAFVELQQHG
jgi:homeobox protein DLX2